MVCARSRFTRTPGSPHAPAPHRRTHALRARARLAAAAAAIALALVGIAPAQAAEVSSAVPNTAPFGHVDSVSTATGSITVSGWALDPDTNNPIAVHIYVDGVGRAVSADGSRPDVAAAFGHGDRHGFTATIPAWAGNHSVCTYAINAPAGDNTVLQCTTVTVTNAQPFGHIDSISTTTSSISVSGWALDPDTNDPIAVHVYVDGAGHAVTADSSRPDVAAAFGHGDRHGFAATITAWAGNHSVCIYPVNVPAGYNAAMQCATVTVTNAAPIGHVDSFNATYNAVTLSGWALDPDTSDPIAVHVYVDGVGRAISADRVRPDIAAAFGHGDRHGFSATIPLSPGYHSVCVYGLNTPAGYNPIIGCQNVGSVIIAIAARYVGVPYLWGGMTPAGFDCSGFTSYVYAQVGVHLPRTSAAQHWAGVSVLRSNAVPGDLIWVDGHIAIFAGGNQMIDSGSGGVHFRPIWQVNPIFVHIG